MNRKEGFHSHLPGFRLTDRDQIALGNSVDSPTGINPRDLPLESDVADLRGDFPDSLLSRISSNRGLRIVGAAVGMGGIGAGAAFAANHVDALRNIPGFHQSVAFADPIPTTVGTPVEPTHIPTVVPTEAPTGIPTTVSTPTEAPVTCTVEPTSPPSETPPPTASATATKEPTASATATKEPTASATPEKSATASATPTPEEEEGQIKIEKFLDEDRDGKTPREGGEHGLIWGFNGVNVDGPKSNDFRMVTDGNGFTIKAVEPGVYEICEDEEPGWELTTGKGPCLEKVVKDGQVTEFVFGNAEIEAPQESPTVTPQPTGVVETATPAPTQVIPEEMPHAGTGGFLDPRKEPGWYAGIVVGLGVIGATFAGLARARTKEEDIIEVPLEE